MKSISLYGFIMLIFVGLFVVSGCISDVSELTRQIREKYDSLDDYKVTVRETRCSKEVTYKYFFKEPNKIYIEYITSGFYDPFLKKDLIMATNGKSWWWYDSSKNEASIEEYEDASGESRGIAALVTSETLADLESNMEFVLENYNIKLLGEESIFDKTAYILEITPKKKFGLFGGDGGINKWWVDKETFLLLKEEQYTTDGILRLRREFMDMEVNTNIPDDKFEFNVPDNAIILTDFNPMDVAYTLEEIKDSASFEVLLPTYIPEGYEYGQGDLSPVEQEDGSCEERVDVTYRKPHIGSFRIEQSKSSLVVRPAASYEPGGITILSDKTIDINGISGRLIIFKMTYPNAPQITSLHFEKDGKYINVDTGHEYSGEGTEVLSEDELIKIANSLD